MDAIEIKDEIDKLEAGETSYQNCTKLAVLYLVYDHLEKPQARMTEAYSYGSSEFLLTVEKAPLDEVFKILDEHMDAIQLLHPKEYAAVIRKIKEISPLN